MRNDVRRSEVDGLPPRRERGFLDRLAQRRVPVTRPRDILRASSVLHGEDALAKELARVGSDDVRAEDLVRVLAADELDHPIGVVVGPRAGVGGEGEGADVVFGSGRLDLLLRLTAPRHLGVGVDDARDDVVVDVAHLSGELLHAADPLLLGFVREHGSLDDVSDGEHAGLRRGVRVHVHDHLAALVDLDAGGFEPEAGGERLTARGDQDDVGLDLDGFAPRGGFDGERHPAWRLGRARDLLLHHELEPLLLERALERLAHLGVHRRADVFGELDHGHLRPEAAPHASELEPDDAAADDDHALGHLLQVERPGGGDDRLLVNLHARERRGFGARGEDDVLGADRLGGAVLLGDDHLAGCRRERSPTLGVGHLVLLE
mmetsp:Transcript_4930/g.20106  ORF Transcript_4930/g.20106 Transcript_4930/m.20106 type:complete len:376 (+) Transcript_4930:97-1224(+)